MEVVNLSNDKGLAWTRVHAQSKIVSVTMSLSRPSSLLARTRGSPNAAHDRAAGARTCAPHSKASRGSSDPRLGWVQMFLRVRGPMSDSRMPSIRDHELVAAAAVRDSSQLSLREAQFLRKRRGTILSAVRSTARASRSAPQRPSVTHRALGKRSTSLPRSALAAEPPVDGKPTYSLPTESALRRSLAKTWRARRSWRLFNDKHLWARTKLVVPWTAGSTSPHRLRRLTITQPLPVPSRG